MTAVTTKPLWRSRPARRRSPAVRTTLALATWFGAVAVWFAAILLVVVVAIPLLIAAFDEVDVSVLWAARQSGIWFPFSILISIAVAYPPVHVASGMTRRSYVRGALAFVVGVAVALSVAMWLGLVAERAWYGAMGWGWELQGGWSGPADDLGRAFVSYLCLFLVAPLSGLLVGTVYAARGGWWGTLTLPLTVGPLVLVMVLVDGGGAWLPFGDVVGGEGTTLDPSAFPVVPGVAAVLAVALALAFRVIATRRAVPPRRG